MKYFPKAWVIPGGHVDKGERIESGVVREILEETGIKIDKQQTKSGLKYYFNDQEVNLEPFFAFESGSHAGSFAPPTSGHLILFYKVKLPVSWTEIDIKL